MSSNTCQGGPKNSARSAIELFRLTVTPDLRARLDAMRARAKEL